MIWNNVRGHAEQVEMFRRAIRRNRMSHAYLFHGPSGIGKTLFARTFAQCLFCSRIPDDQLDACGECGNCRQMQAGSHTDFHEIRCRDDKANLLIEQFVGKRDERGRAGLCYDISRRPMSSERRIAVIDDADRFNDESANSFLKTLEEPPDYATLILISEDPDAQLPTIRSRCQDVRFAALSEADVAELLVTTGQVETDDEARAVAAVSDGSLTIAAQLLDPAFRELRRTIHSTLAAGDFHSGQAADAVTAVITSSGEMPAQRRAAVWAVRFCIEYFAGQLRAGTPNQSELLGCLIERAAETTRQIEANLQVALCVQALFHDLGRLSRSPVY
jgi:DNA polymerase III subunit delta'